MQPFLENERITSEEELRDMLGYPSPLVMNKTIDHIDHHAMNFIRHSPIIFISTSDASGSCDVSPRGDAAGFVHMIDDKHLVIPERPGNRRLDSILNILSNPHIGIVFVIPQIEETLRVNGKACVIKDKNILEAMSANGKMPLVGIGVTVEECYIHCAKSFKRSKLWHPESWADRSTLPRPSEILAAHARAKEEDVQKSLKESYEKRLY
ncbi:pyridoxamine 5'-phosphate oxidase family protein [Paenibacillus faecalis]|uniref:pyridoxamine 5'-phosphate oxidase family protein n=1 Tax=Paenibacillus faecalis TaxID=2079532 RepID=UPI000D0FE5B8|nr:pyridoxamine 5'-phosphate oxidase family protein [Paenibacillus faecalis]